MSDVYCNMSVPPRTRIHKEVRPVGRHLVFDLPRLAGIPADADESQLAAWLDGYLGFHAADVEAAPRPDGYMIAIPLRRAAPLPDGFSLCQDLGLTVAVLGRLAGGIYIPVRRPRLLPASVNTPRAFPEKFFTGTRKDTP